MHIRRHHDLQVSSSSSTPLTIPYLTNKTSHKPTQLTPSATCPSLTKANATAARVRQQPPAHLCHRLTFAASWTADIDAEKHVLCHCGACKLMSGGEFTLNQIIPKDAFKLTKGNLNKYTYKGDSGKFASALPHRIRG